MDRRFSRVVDGLHKKYKSLVRTRPISQGAHPKNLPKRGVYLFSIGGKPLYVGRSNNLRSRYSGHTLPCMKDQSAPFAFKLACDDTNTPRSAKDREKTRKELMEWPKFRKAFDKAKADIRKMEFRWVEETDPVKQALLEAYCAIVLETPFNDFENH